MSARDPRVYLPPASAFLLTHIADQTLGKYLRIAIPADYYRSFLPTNTHWRAVERRLVVARELALLSDRHEAVFLDFFCRWTISLRR